MLSAAMPNVTYDPFILSVVMPNVTYDPFLLSVVLLNVMAPFLALSRKQIELKLSEFVKKY
jgi:hypothetical protein